MVLPRTMVLIEDTNYCVLAHFCCFQIVFIITLSSRLCLLVYLFSLKRLARTGIIVTTSEAVLLQLVADKDHPKFKEIQNLIKASAPESGLLSKV